MCTIKKNPSPQTCTRTRTLIYFRNRCYQLGSLIRYLRLIFQYCNLMNCTNITIKYIIFWPFVCVSRLGGELLGFRLTELVFLELRIYNTSDTHTGPFPHTGYYFQC